MEDTRQRLIQGARRCLIEHGHQEFSVRKAARCAGINHGMVHHLFGSKENLVLAVMEQEFGQFGEERGNWTDEPGGAMTEEEAELRRKWLIEHLVNDDGHVALLREMLSLAQEMPALKQMMVEHLRARREGLTRRFGAQNQGADTLIMAAIMGLHFLRAIDPDLPVEAAVGCLWQLGKGLVTEKVNQ